LLLITIFTVYSFFALKSIVETFFKFRSDIGFSVSYLLPMPCRAGQNEAVAPSTILEYCEHFPVLGAVEFVAGNTVSPDIVAFVSEKGARIPLLKRRLDSLQYMV